MYYKVNKETHTIMKTHKSEQGAQRFSICKKDLIAILKTQEAKLKDELFDVQAKLRAVKQLQLQDT